METITDSDINDAWKYHAKECFRLAQVARESGDASGIELAAHHGAIARSIYEHGWLSRTVVYEYVEPERQGFFRSAMSLVGLD